MVHQEQGFVSIGGVANKLGVSTTMVRQYEKRGLIPRGQRLEGSRSRIWPLADVEIAQARIAERRAQQKGALQPTAA